MLQIYSLFFLPHIIMLKYFVVNDWSVIEHQSTKINHTVTQERYN